MTKRHRGNETIYPMGRGNQQFVLIVEVLVELEKGELEKGELRINLTSVNGIQRSRLLIDTVTSWSNYIGVALRHQDDIVVREGKFSEQFNFTIKSTVGDEYWLQLVFQDEGQTQFDGHRGLFAIYIAGRGVMGLYNQVVKFLTPNITEVFVKAGHQLNASIDLNRQTAFFQIPDLINHTAVLPEYLRYGEVKYIEALPVGMDRLNPMATFDKTTFSAFVIDSSNAKKVGIVRHYPPPSTDVVNMTTEDSNLDIKVDLSLTPINYPYILTPL